MIVSISTAFTNSSDTQVEHDAKKLESFSTQAILEKIERSVSLLEEKIDNLSLQVKKAELS